MNRTWVLRKYFSEMTTVEAMEFLQKQMSLTENQRGVPRHDEPVNRNQTLNGEKIWFCVPWLRCALPEAFAWGQKGHDVVGSRCRVAIVAPRRQAQ